MPKATTDKNLTGAQIIERLQRGHLVRRACWQDDVYIRICNEKGFDENGLAIFNDKVPLYTHCTNGYFLHLGYSSQPFRATRVYADGGVYYEAMRDGDGIAMLFANDWEDYGFISSEEFSKLTDKLKNRIMKKRELMVKQAIAEKTGDAK